MEITFSKLWEDIFQDFYNNNDEHWCVIRSGIMENEPPATNDERLCVICREFSSVLEKKRPSDSGKDASGYHACVGALWNNKPTKNSATNVTIAELRERVMADNFRSMEQDLRRLFTDSVAYRRYQEIKGSHPSVQKMKDFQCKHQEELQLYYVSRMEEMAKTLEEKYGQLFREHGIQGQIDGDHALNWLVLAVCLAISTMKPFNQLKPKQQNTLNDFEQKMLEYAGEFVSGMPSDENSYFEVLWNGLVKAQNRDKKSEQFRDLVEVYVKPKFSHEPDGELLSIPLLGTEDSFRRVILSPSGYGKTTMMRAVALCTLADRIEASRPRQDAYRALQEHFFGDKDPKEFVPVFIEANRFNDRADVASLKNLAMGSDNLRFDSILYEAHQKGKLLILIDAIDEVKRGNQKAFYHKLKRLMKDYPKASYLVTSRFRGQLDNAFLARYLLKFDTDDVEKLLKLLLPNMDTIPKILERVRTNSYWEELFSNPYLSTSIVYGCDVGNIDNLNPSKMTRDAIKSIILRRWEKENSDIVREALGCLALYAVCNQTESLTSEELRNSFDTAKKLFGHDDLAVDAEEMGWRSGILILDDESGEDTFSFQSPILLYELAGFCVAKLLSRYADPKTRGREIEKFIQLCCLEDSGNPVRFFETNDSDTEELIVCYALGKLLHGGEATIFGQMLLLSRILNGDEETLTEMKAKTLVSAITQLSDRSQQTAIVEYLLCKYLDEEQREQASLALREILDKKYGSNNVTNRGALRKKVEACLG